MTEQKHSACPFCGGEVDPTGWLRGDGVRGPECDDCGATAPSMEVWEQRAALAQPSPAAALEQPDITTKHGYPAYSVAQHDRIVGALRAEVQRWKEQFACMQLQRDHHRDRADAAQARVAELEKQEPVHWRALLDPSEIPQQLNPHMHVTGFVTQRAAEDWIAAQCDFDGWHYTLEPLYAAPVAQAGQVPDVLFDGFAVYQALSDKAKGRTTSHHVSDTLDAAVKLIRAAAPAQGGE
jgi:hypothetical protein